MLTNTSRLFFPPELVEEMENTAVSLQYHHYLLFLVHPSGSPGSPQEILVTKSASGLTLQWTEGDAGEKPTTGYIIEARPSGKPGEV